MAVVVLQDAAVVLSRGYGLADIASQTPVDERTVFQLGSISKQFLAALVVVLAGDRALSLDDPIGQHLPGLAHVPPTVRVRHLLTHTSGIRELFQLPGALEAFDDLSRTRGELMETVRKAPVDFPPGTRWSYSNTNYTLLAALVERVTGKPYEEAIVERLFAPLGLHSLRQCRSVPQGPAEARGYLREGTANTPAAPENMEWIRGDGGFCGTALDLARWTQLLSNGRVIAAEQYARMIAPARLDSGKEVDYGFALALVRPDGVRKVSHGGAMRGYSAQAAHYPDRRLTVVVLTNRGDVRADAIEREIARAVLNLPEPLRDEVPLSTSERAAFAGTYDLAVFDIRIAERAGGLWLEAPPPGPTTPLRYLGDGRFVSDEEPDGTAVQLAPDRATLTLYMGAMHWYGVKR
jgi:D-alanyl-D-alanine carboxypeptidase